MSLLSVVRDVCAVVGVEQPTSVFSNINVTRTMQEMLTCANEQAQRIAYDTRDWRVLSVRANFIGDSAANQTTDFTLPSNFKRFLLTTQLWRGSNTSMPLRFVPDLNEWVMRRNANRVDGPGEWTQYSGQLHIVPALADGEVVLFTYLENVCILPHGDPAMRSDVFQNDDDTYRLNERLLKLAMIWAWKAQKGSPYAEDMANYATALDMVAGADSPAPIIIGRMPISASARVAYPWPPGWGP